MSGQTICEGLRPQTFPDQPYRKVEIIGALKAVVDRSEEVGLISGSPKTFREMIGSVGYQKRNLHTKTHASSALHLLIHTPVNLFH